MARRMADGAGTTRASALRRGVSGLRSNVDWRVGSGPRGSAARGRSAWTNRLGDALRGRHRCSRAQACRWRARRTAHEALGCSRGGFSTKVHLRVEGGGKPMTFVVSGWGASRIALRRGASHRRAGAPNRTRATAQSPCATRARQGLQLSDCTPAARPPRDPRRHSAPLEPAASRPAPSSIRPCHIPQAPPGRAPHQSTETVPPCRNTLREARHHPLPGHAHTSRHVALALSGD